MTQILLSVQPQWAEKILNGTKTIEIRKSVPKDLPCEVLMYVTKNKSKFRVGCMEFANDDLYILPNQKLYKFGCSVEIMGCELPYSKDNFLNGKVVAKFTLNKADTLEHCQWVNQQVETYTPRGIISNFEILDKACLDIVELCAYGKGKPLYAWHIDDLVIFDQPKELGEFYITKAPMSWQRVKGE